jgi:hypothetical protein
MRAIRDTLSGKDFGCLAAGLVDVLSPHARRATAALVIWEPEAVGTKGKVPTEHGL